MSETDNQEIEIDLLELLQEFKRNLAKIIGVTLLFVAVGTIYVFTVPKYSYSQLLDCSSLSDHDKIGFINIFSQDVVDNKGHGRMWKEPKKCALVKVELINERNINTNLLKFEFQGTEPGLIIKEGRVYTEDALKKVNERIVKLHELKYGQEYFNTVRNEMTRINSSLQDGTMTYQGAAQYLKLLEERLEMTEKNKMLTLAKAELVPNRLDEAEEIPRLKYIIPICVVLSLFLSFVWLTGRYCWKKSKK